MNDDRNEWFADEDFWVTTYPFMFPDSRIEAARAEADQILALAGRTEGDVLDLACGPGRHSMALAQRGLAVTGVDRSSFLLDKARARAKELGLTVEWVQSDMRDFTRPAAFDLALSLFTSFGFFRDDADNQRVLDNVAVSLRPGGVLVLDMVGKEVLARIFNPTSSLETPDGIVVQRRNVVDNWNRMQNEWILLQRETARTFRFSHWIYSGREIERMFHDAGFTHVRLCADFLGTPYGLDSRRLVVVGRK